MGERKGVNKYYPPDFDPSKGSLNSWLGTHPLRDRARKLHKGILVIRFEMPYNIWCDGCNNHIGMGVRYNAEKSKVGNYYTTPIYKFRMKCHLCDNHFEIQTDPKNHDYVILGGARRKEQRWDPRENEQIVPEDKATQKKLATDPMYKLEHGSDDKVRGKATQISVAQIEDMRDSWNDDYILNKMARNKFRGEKKQISETKAADKALLDKSSLDIELVPESEEDQRLAGLLKYSVTKSFDEKQQEKRKAIENRPLFHQQPASNSPSLLQEGHLSRRAEIKYKLGLHLSSSHKEHIPKAGKGFSTMKDLIKSRKNTPTKTCSSTLCASSQFSHSQSLLPEDFERVSDESVTPKEDSKNLPTTVSSPLTSQEDYDQSATLYLQRDERDTAEKNLVCASPEDPFINSRTSELCVSREIEKKLSDKTGLATIMASYSESDSESSDITDT